MNNIIEIAPLNNGAHRNQTYNGNLPEGWAVIPSNMLTPNFPFGDVKAEMVEGRMTVTKWTALPMPEPEPVNPEPTTEEILLEMAADHEERICLMELGI